MKKHLVTAGKMLAFFIMWIASATTTIIPVIGEPPFLSGNAPLRRFWWELLPLLGILLATAFFVLVVEKKKISVPILENLLKNVVWGLALGCVWLGSVMIFLPVIGVLSFGDRTNVPYFPIWFIAVFFNVVMQEYLVRGYLYSLLKEKYNAATAVIITTILFAALHGGAFEAGIVAVLNVMTMSLFVSLLLIYTESLLAPILAHFCWNAPGILIFGVVSSAEDYPSLWKGSLSGNSLISGGSFQLEGSIAVLVVNVLFIAFMAFMLTRRSRESQKGLTQKMKI